MKPPPAARRATGRTFREVQKQARAFDGDQRVRVFSEDGYFVTRLDSTRDSQQIARLLAAPNSVAVWKHDGKLVAIRLRSFGDDRGHAGEEHGRSTVTTERVRNDRGEYIGTDKNVEHKQSCKTWGKPAVNVRTETVPGCKMQ